MCTMTYLLLTLLLCNVSRSQYNYLCDFDTKFTVNTVGKWTFDSNSCHVTQTNYVTAWGAVAWIGNNINTLKWTNYTIESVINTQETAAGEGYVGIIFRAQKIDGYVEDYGDYYGTTLGYTGTLFKVANLRYNKEPAAFTTLNKIGSTSGQHTTKNEDHNLTIEVVGNSFTVYMDGVYAFTSKDTKYKSGSIGLRSTYARTTFKQLYITLPTNTTTPPTYSPTISTTISPTTSEPTTSEPTTSEPTTSEPTTSEPTTSEPTTSE
eukprot:345468_1